MTFAVEMGLDLRDGAFGRPSTKTVPWHLALEREITPEDMALLQGPADPCNSRAPLAKIRAPHHMMAQYLAAGKSRIEISALLGYTPARIATLERDPAFMELVAHYTEVKILADADISKQIQHVALAASQELMDRLEEDPTAFSNKELLELRNSSLDRSGYGPSSTQNVNVNNTTKIIEALVSQTIVEQASRIIPKASLLPTIEAEYVEATSCEGTAERGANDRGSLASGTETPGPGPGGDSLSEESP